MDLLPIIFVNEADFLVDFFVGRKIVYIFAVVFMV